MIYLLAFASTALACYLIIRSVDLHLHITGDHPGIQPQKFHTHPTPRVGGLAVFVGLVVSGLVLDVRPADVSVYWALILSLMPAFLGGFAEDVTHRVGPGVRLLLTVITAAFAYTLAGVHFERSDMVWLDHALTFLPFGYAALLFAVAGVAHSMNLIDGYNGLASGFSIIVLCALGCIANQTYDHLLAALCFGTAAATAGFLIFNYPRGRIFLGDGGAYLLGCIIALASALLILRHNNVSPWFPMALVVYPVWETLFSVIRRAVVYGTKIGEPDAKHMHSLVYRRVSRRWVRGRRAGDKAWRNSLTTIPFWAICGVMAVLAVMWARDTRALQVLIVLFIVGYSVVYRRLARLAAHIGPSHVERGGSAPGDPAINSGQQVGK